MRCLIRRLDRLEQQTAHAPRSWSNVFREIEEQATAILSPEEQRLLEPVLACNYRRSDPSREQGQALAEWEEAFTGFRKD